ncbi:hypothetical protein PROFUN_15447 [Planoprotostelium fungivorum]|uniref:Ankyrin repeat protein n=1 Tax=Planoprotostelium fungivorum TaxID=1890364 RepID=A0A2P6MW53_9EUKA|nr:hypothetical protein PROFUN_15447 [Planoprotostelium fungivorum]
MWHNTKVLTQVEGEKDASDGSKGGEDNTDEASVERTFSESIMNGRSDIQFHQFACIFVPPGGQALEETTRPSYVQPHLVTQRLCGFSCAAIKGHTETVRFLLSDPRVDPSARDNEAFRGAATEGHTEAVQLLLSDARVERKRREQYMQYKTSIKAKTKRKIESTSATKVAKRASDAIDR